MPVVPVMVQPSKVAMPNTAVMGLAVQSSVPVPLATARVTDAAEVVAVLPAESWTVTLGCVVRAVPLSAPDGWAVMTSLVATPADSTKLVEVAVVSPVALAVRV